MKALIYKPTGETWYFPNVALCYWKRNQLKATGSFNGKFEVR